MAAAENGLASVRKRLLLATTVAALISPNVGQVPARLPQECLAFATCGTGGVGQTAGRSADWVAFREQLEKAVQLERSNAAAAMEVYYRLMEDYTRDAGVALQCRLGAASVFFRLGRQYQALGYAQRAANLFQLAMSMVWDSSRAENGMACLDFELWGVRWFDEFMDTYLTHAAQLRRNDVTMLPYPPHWQVPPDYRDPNLRIAIYSLCDYSAESPMHWLLERSLANRQAYCSRHGYGLEWYSKKPVTGANRHPVWGQLAGPMELLEQTEKPYDYILSMDCDAIVLDMSVTVDSILYRFASRETPWGRLELDPDVHFLVSEDGRGLAGGNWIVRNSPQGRSFMRDVYGPDDIAENPYMRHDLRDQFSLLWHLIRPGVSLPLPPEPRAADVVAAGGRPVQPVSWPEIGYSVGVRLVPQELLLGAYPYVSCSQPGDRAHRCIRGKGAQSGGDFIVHVPLLGALPRQMGQALIDRFLLESLGTFGKGQGVYEDELRGLCADMDISRCMLSKGGSAAT